MDISEFSAQMQILDVALVGKGKQIARAAKVSYGTYLNYRSGRGSDPKTMEDILRASRKVALEVKHYLNSQNITP